jgi:alkanesulfonate monooxygenase SsuD/methylene tetrahydromethanopterin reductase-like flavin-dependent oxidoreductase (luciferase family)
MKVGIVLPTFREDPREAIEVARRAAACGLDGVFAYDHLHPMGSPERPALAPFPVLASIGALGLDLTLGTLVARIGLVANHILIEQFEALAALSDGRVVCAAGTGDRLSTEENASWGIPVASAAERRAQLEELSAEMLGRGHEVWIGGGARPTLEMAERIGAIVNLWNASDEVVAEQARSTRVTWAGPPPADGDLSGLGRKLAAAGAEWAVFGGTADVEALATVSRP